MSCWKFIHSVGAAKVGGKAARASSTVKRRENFNSSIFFLLFVNIIMMLKLLMRIGGGFPTTKWPRRLSTIHEEWTRTSHKFELKSLPAGRLILIKLSLIYFTLSEHCWDFNFLSISLFFLSPEKLQQVSVSISNIIIVSYLGMGAVEIIKNCWRISFFVWLEVLVHFPR